MKAQLNKYRQYTISDYLLNPNKFIEYLEFCKKYHLKKEKKYIMDNLFLTLQFKESCGNAKLLSELKKLCVFLIIYSDFEIELLFDLEHFYPNTHKKIFIEIDSYLNINNNDPNYNEIKTYIGYKYNFWILKLQNKYFISGIEAKNYVVGENEILESIEKLNNYINIPKDNTKKLEQSEQLFILKIYYELSLYYYFKDNINNAANYLKILINNYNEYISTYNIDINSKEHKLIYFDIEKVKYLYNYLTEKEASNSIINNDIIMDDNNIDNIFFSEEDISCYNKVLDEDCDKYKNEINKVKNDYMKQLSLSNESALNSCEINNKNCTSSLLNCLNISGYLIDISLKNYDFYKDATNFIESLKAKAENKIKANSNKKEESDLQYVKKELSYYGTLIQIIENLINNEDKLHKNFLKNLSQFIIDYTLTGNLKLSGLIHSNIINFSHNLKMINKYFEGFTQFFKDKKSVYKKETINQIEFITIIVELFYTITEQKNKINFPLEKEIVIDIKQELHVNLINIFIYWLSCDDNNSNNTKDDAKKKETKKIKKTLRYNPSVNIIFILIESLKNLEFLKILKVIISNVLEFIVNKKHLNDTENSSELFDYIYEIKPKLFKINNLLDGVLRNVKVIVEEQVYYINFKINFKESPNENSYMIKNEHLFCYISTLFKLLRIINDKIYKFESIKKITEIKSKNNIQDLNERLDYIINEDNKDSENSNDIINNIKNNFLLYFYYIIENNIFKIEKEVKLGIMCGINYLNLYMQNFKNMYMKNDLIADISKIKKNYDTFKALLNQDILYQLILCLIKQKRYLEGVILLQYTKKFDSIVAYKLLQYTCEKNDIINIENFRFIWKIVLFEYLANYFYKNNNYNALTRIKKLIKRVSNHQFFKGHPFRRHFKIVNFLNFLDYLNNNKFNF